MGPRFNWLKDIEKALFDIDIATSRFSTGKTGTTTVVFALTLARFFGRRKRMTSRAEAATKSSAETITAAEITPDQTGLLKPNVTLLAVAGQFVSEHAVNTTRSMSAH